jgi:hypothetical protein
MESNSKAWLYMPYDSAKQSAKYLVRTCDQHSDGRIPKRRGRSAQLQLSRRTSRKRWPLLLEKRGVQCARQDNTIVKRGALHHAATPV